MTVPDEVVGVMAAAICEAELIDPGKPCIGMGKLIPEGEHCTAQDVRAILVRAALSALEQAGYRVVKFRTAKPTPFDFSDDATTIPDSVG
jgi:hypothetical protein